MLVIIKSGIFSFSIPKVILYLNDTLTLVGSMSISKYPFLVGAITFAAMCSFSSIIGTKVIEELVSLVMSLS